MSIDLERLDKGSGMEITLTNNQAVWHKSYCNKFNTTKLKRKYSTVDEPVIYPSKKYTRKSTLQEPMKDTVNREIFVYENIHELNFLVNKFSWVPGTHENILTRNFLSQ